MCGKENIIEETTYSGIVKRLIYVGMGSHSVPVPKDDFTGRAAIVAAQKEDGRVVEEWFPEKGQELAEGQEITITPITHHDSTSGGSSTTYRLTPVSL